MSSTLAVAGLVALLSQGAAPVTCGDLGRYSPLQVETLRGPPRTAVTATCGGGPDRYGNATKPFECLVWTYDGWILTFSPAEAWLAELRDYLRGQGGAGDFEALRRPHRNAKAVVVNCRILASADPSRRWILRSCVEDGLEAPCERFLGERREAIFCETLGAAAAWVKEHCAEGAAGPAQGAPKPDAAPKPRER